ENLRGHRKLSGRTLAGVGITAGVAVLAALGGNLPAAAQEGVIIGANAEDAIDNSYIVVLKDGTSVTDVADRHGADVEHVYEHALNGFSATMSEAKKQIGKHTSELQSRENIVCRILLEIQNRKNQLVH